MNHLSMKKKFVPNSNLALTVAVMSALSALSALTVVSQASYAQTVQATQTAQPIRVNGVACNLSPLQVLVTSAGVDITVPPSCVGVTAPLPVAPPPPTVSPPATTPTTPPATTPPVTPPVGTVPSGCGAGVDCSVEGDIIPTPSRTNPGGNNAFRTGKLNGLSPVNALMNSYAAENVAAKCSNATPAITRLWQHNIDFTKYQNSGGNDYPFLAANEAITFKFTAPAEGKSNIFQYNEGTQVSFVSGFMSVSDKPCDFDVNKLVAGPGRSACFSSEAYGLSIYYRSTAGAVATYECKMVPGQTYYLNLRMQDARPVSRGGTPTIDSCASSGSGLCGGYVQIR